MRISVDGLKIEEAQEILRWMEMDGAKLFLSQIAITESQTIERLLRNEDKDKLATEVLSLRAFPAYHDQLINFLEERVTQESEK